MSPRKKRPAKQEPSKHEASAKRAESVCERCGRLMVDLHVPTLVDEGGPAHRVARHCPACGHVVDTHSLGHHHDESGMDRQEGKR